MWSQHDSALIERLEMDRQVKVHLIRKKARLFSTTRSVTAGENYPLTSQVQLQQQNRVGKQVFSGVQTPYKQSDILDKVLWYPYKCQKLTKAEDSWILILLCKVILQPGNCNYGEHLC